jgi:hypothetical protein
VEREPQDLIVRVGDVEGESVGLCPSREILDAFVFELIHLAHQSLARGIRSRRQRSAIP